MKHLTFLSYFVWTSKCFVEAGIYMNFKNYLYIAFFNQALLPSIPSFSRRISESTSCHSAPNSPIGTPGANMAHLQT